MSDTKSRTIAKNILANALKDNLSASLKEYEGLHKNIIFYTICSLLDFSLKEKEKEKVLEIEKALYFLMDLPAFDINYKDRLGSNILNILMRYEPSITLTSHIISKGVDINNKDYSSHPTPLLRACDLQNIEMIDLLLKNGAKPNSKNSSGINALMVIIENTSKSIQEKVEIIELLLSSGLDINANSPKFGTAIAFACSLEGQEKIIPHLLNLGAEPKILANNQKQYNAFDTCASKNDNIETMKILFQTLSDFEAIEYIDRALFVAKRHSQESMVRFISSYKNLLEERKSLLGSLTPLKENTSLSKNKKI